ncbi:carboxylesterase family domain-containing protein [Phthorimaea operculella]|nr:carboxylesterase family domain-containing protein [Phthorimaea operculella]
MFLGIPYANVNRTNIFGASIPQEPFEEVFEAYDDDDKCPQVEEFNSTAIGTLDCLKLNIFVPDTASSQNLLPVMVYIYGGGLKHGFADRFALGPKYLVRHDVILVTFNYRLGPYGFMCLDTPEISGNAGLKDQVTALRWVKSNIQSFGGNPNQITAFGNSAGGRSIGMHLTSESEKLFNNAIIQSGSVFRNDLVSVNENSNVVLQLAKELDFETNDVNEAINFLSSSDAKRVVQVAGNKNINFLPCLEKQFDGVERFLTKHPIVANHSKADGMAFMIGCTSDENLIDFIAEVGPEAWNKWEQLFSTRLNVLFDFNNDTLRHELSDLIRRFYLGDAEINDEVRKQMTEFMDDTTYTYSTIRSIKPYLTAGADKIYQYVFSYDGGRNYIKYITGIFNYFPGVSHSDEIGYLFDVGVFQDEPSEEDQVVIDRMTTMWTNFAKYRNPTPETTPLLPVTWQPIVNGSAYHYLDINLELTSEVGYEHRRMSFWDLFYKSYGQYERARIIANSATALYFYSNLLIVVIFVNLFV